MDNQLGCIYQIRNIVNGKCYIGSSIQIDKRFQLHKWELNRGNHHSIALQRAWNKYGCDNFVFEIIKEVSKDFLLAEEQNEIDKYIMGKNIYNSNPVARNPPHKVGEEHGEAKLTWNEVKQIRHLYNNEDYTQKDLAKKFNMSQVVIWQIVHNASWYDENYKPKISYTDRDRKLPKGTEHHNAVFNKKQVDEIRHRYNSEKIGCKQLAQIYETTAACILRVVQNKSYIDVDYVPAYSSKEKKSSKLNWDIVHNIRNERTQTGLSHEKLAKKFGLSRQTILKIVNNDAWKE